MKRFNAFLIAGLLIPAPLWAQQPVTLTPAPSALPPAAPEPGPNSAGIIAVVNDEVISSRDLGSRLAFVFATTRLEDLPEVRDRLKPQVLRSLLDEKLQYQEAIRSGISVTDKDIEEAVAGIEQQRGLPSGQLLGHLEEIGVPPSTFTDQVRTQIAWNKLVVRKLKPLVKISDDEVERERGKASRSGRPEVEIEMLTLPVDRPESDAQVRALAEKLASGIRAGAPFESVARELAPASMQQEIKPVWAPVDQLDPALQAALSQTQQGAITDPVRTLDGYVVAKLLNMRMSQGVSNITEVAFKDILVTPKAANTPDEATVKAAVDSVLREPGSCEDMMIASAKDWPAFDVQAKLKRESLEALPVAVRELLGSLSVGAISEPVATEEGIRMFMLCERMEKPGPMADAEEVTQQIFRRKLELEAQKYMRQLRRDATIDVRLGPPS